MGIDRGFNKKCLAVALCAVLGGSAFALDATPAPPPATSPAMPAADSPAPPPKPDKAVLMKALSVVAYRYDATNMRMDSINTVDVLSAAE